MPSMRLFHRKNRARHALDAMVFDGDAALVSMPPRPRRAPRWRRPTGPGIDVIAYWVSEKYDGGASSGRPELFPRRGLPIRGATWSEQLAGCPWTVNSGLGADVLSKFRPPWPKACRKMRRGAHCATWCSICPGSQAASANACRTCGKPSPR